MAQPTVDDCRVTGFILPATVGDHQIATGTYQGQPYTYLVDTSDPDWELMDDSFVTLQGYQTLLDVVSGSVLIAGLGLGCLVRGLLTAGVATSIDIIEVEQDIIDLVSPYFPEPEVNIIHADALTYDGWTPGKTWDTVFFDCFSGGAQNTKLFAVLEERYWDRMERLGCWDRPKYPDGNLMIERAA